MLFTYRDCLDKLQHVANFLVEAGQPETSKPIQQLRNAGIFGNKVFTDTINSSTLSFENLMDKLAPGVYLTEDDRRGLRQVFVDIKAFCANNRR